MRILYSHRIQSRDGMSVHVEELVAAFRRAGHEVLVVGPGFYKSADFGGESSLIAQIRSRLPGVIGEAAELAYNLPSYRRLRRAVSAFKPDLVYERYNLYYLAGALVARWQGVPYYLEVNAPIAEERALYSNLRLKRLSRAMEDRVWRSADRVLAVTEVLKSMIVARGVAPERVVVIPNGIDPGRFAEWPEPARDPAEVVLGFVGFVRTWHGLDAVIKAMAAYAGPPRLRLVIIGDGPARPELEALTASLGLGERVRFTGIAQPADVPRLVAGFDIALQPKVVAYASPLKVFDYMAAGRAIVAPDQPNIREILADGQTALLFDPAVPDAMWQAIHRLIREPELRHRLGAAARRELDTRNYTWPANAERVVALARRDLASGRPQAEAHAPLATG